MAFSTQRAVSDGTLQDLALEIEFIDRVDVVVFIDDVPQTVDVDYEWTSDTLIHFTVAVPSGSEVLLQRNTSLDGVLNVFSLGAIFNNPTMDENFRQILFIAQEAREGSTLEDVFRNLNMHGYRIQNLGAGTEPGDAINYQQYMDDALGAGGARAAAEAARNAAAAARDSATASATTATDQAGIATAQATAALASANDAVAAAVETGDDVATIQLLYDAIALTPGGGMKPLLYPEWAPARAIIQAGYVAADGQLLSRTTYADAWEQAQLAGLVVTDAVWLSTPTERGKFSSGDGSTTFRLPDYNGKFAGSLGAVFMRGDGAAGFATGSIRQDQMQRIQGKTGMSMSLATPQGAFVMDAITPNGGGITSTNTSSTVAFDSALAARTGTETFPTHVVGCWVIKLFGAVVNVGSADAAQLASDYANLAAELQTLDSQIDFTIIYPNGGSAASPASVATNTRYVEDNPFPGFHVHCQAEVLRAGEWGDPRSTGDANNTWGTAATQLDGGNIIVRTGSLAVASSPQLTLAPSAATGVLTSAPCRVLVWKVKGAIA